MRRGKRLGWTLLAVLGLAALAIFGLAGHKPADDGLKAPGLPHEQLVPGPATLSSFLAGAHGRPAAVVFWASWCGPCAEEAPELERFSEGSIGHDRIAGVDWSDGLTGARSFIRHYRWTFPNTRDAEGTVGNSYGLENLPTTFVLDGDGRISAALRGAQTQRSLAAAFAKAEHS